MATPPDKQTAIDALLGRALRDKTFRAALIANPHEAAKDSGLTAEELNLVAGGISLAGTAAGGPSTVAFCTAKTCNEKGGTRITQEFGPIVNPAVSENPASNPTPGGP